MLPEMSTQNSMLVITRWLRGSPNRCGPARMTITTPSSNGASDSAAATAARSQRPRPTVTWSSGSTNGRPSCRQTQYSSPSGSTSSAKTLGCANVMADLRRARLEVRRRRDRCGRLAGQVLIRREQGLDVHLPCPVGLVQPGFDLSQQRAGFFVLAQQCHGSHRIGVFELQAAAPIRQQQAFDLGLAGAVEPALDGAGHQGF